VAGGRWQVAVRCMWDAWFGFAHHDDSCVSASLDADAAIAIAKAIATATATATATAFVIADHRLKTFIQLTSILLSAGSAPLSTVFNYFLDIDIL